MTSDAFEADEKAGVLLRQKMSDVNYIFKHPVTTVGLSVDKTRTDAMNGAAIPNWQHTGQS